jgi:hypothetical protein
MRSKDSAAFSGPSPSYVFVAFVTSWDQSNSESVIKGQTAAERPHSSALAIRAPSARLASFA